MPISTQQQNSISIYTKEKNRYDLLASTLRDVLYSVALDFDPLAIVTARAKGISSFAEKIIKKNKYKDPLREVTDLAGARIIVHFPKQVERVCKFIKENFEIDDVNSFDHSNNLKIGEFGYRSIHYIVTPNRADINGIEIPREIRNLKAEIQVRTFMEHNWADIGHDRLYKTNIKVPEKWNREAARLAAIMENAENDFTAMAHTLDSFAAGFRMNYTPDNIEAEIDKLVTLIELEQNPDAKLMNILRLCNVFALQGAWENIIVIINKHLQDQEETILVLQIKVEFYYAQIILLRGQEGSSDFKKLIDDLLAIVIKLEIIIKEGKVDITFIIIFATAKAFNYLGQALINDNSRIDEAREYLNKAHRLVPDDPYFFIMAVLFEIMNCQQAMAGNMLQLLVPQLEHAAKQCITHLEIGANSALAYATMGKIYFLLGLKIKALSAYTKAIDLILSGKTLISNDFLWEELNELEFLSKKSTAGVSYTKADGSLLDPVLALQIQIIICLALWIKNEDPRALKFLQERLNHRVSDSKPLSKNILVVAGGAEGLPRARVQAYHEYVFEALLDFEGTVISGGTRSGIPGLVGNVTDMIRQTGSREYELIGYLPDDPLPADAIIDQNYDQILRTNGKGFSAMELLTYWYDILISGIHSSDVFVLGINGGQISDLEYKLALAFGATVGLITSSGRAVADLMLDNLWNSHPNLLPIPDDKYTIWALVNHSKPTKIDDKDINKMAPVIHEKYRQITFNDPSFKYDSTDVNFFKPLMDWKYLDPKLKLSNEHQARLLEHMLKKVDLSIEKVDDPVLYNLEHPQQLFDKLAKIEHSRWNAERLLAGWRYGPEKDINLKLSPYIVAWEDLPDYMLIYDYQAVKAFPEILASLNYEIQEK